jgi:hypothetical protein
MSDRRKEVLTHIASQALRKEAAGSLSRFFKRIPKALRSAGGATKRVLTSKPGAEQAANMVGDWRGVGTALGLGAAGGGALLLSQTGKQASVLYKMAAKALHSASSLPKSKGADLPEPEVGGSLARSAKISRPQSSGRAGKRQRDMFRVPDVPKIPVS